MDYINWENAFKQHTYQNNYQVNDLANRFSYMNIRDTPYIEEVMDDLMEMQ